MGEIVNWTWTAGVTVGGVMEGRGYGGEEMMEGVM